ncbi:MAG: hypothetical protein Q9222_007938, partial [Ikaeria aurantiellina]
MPRSIREPSLTEIILLPLIPPSVDSGSGVRVASGEVFARRAVGVGEDAGAGLLEAEGGEGGVPGEGGGVVLGA